jgi:hypothetical protein
MKSRAAVMSRSSAAVLRESSAQPAKKANLPSAKPCPSKGTPVHHILPFERWARQVWRQDRAKSLSAIIRRSLRTCKYRIKGTRKPDYDDIAALLRSEYGFSFLEHLMGEASPAWWRGIAKAQSLAATRKQLAEAQRRIAQIELEFD